MENAELGKRVVACVPLERWHEGTVAIDPQEPKARWIKTGEQWRLWDGTSAGTKRIGRLVPDLTASATLGVALALLRAARRRPNLSVLVIGNATRLGDATGWAGDTLEGATEAETIVDGLEKALRCGLLLAD